MWHKLIFGSVFTVAAISISFGLSWPDGHVNEVAAARPTATSSVPPLPTTAPPPTPATTPSPKPALMPSPNLAPALVSVPWPGRPAATTLHENTIDWCPAVRVKGATEAKGIFGAAAVEQAACAAVQFLFEQRYSRLALPRRTYASDDFDFVLPTITHLTTETYYRSRINAVVANPRSAVNRARLGIMLFSDPAAGSGRTFYGKPFTSAGYTDRAVWINPLWSAVSLRVNHSTVRPRIVATLDASAAVPVFNTAVRRDDMMTVPTRAQFTLSQSGKDWDISGWNIQTGTVDYAKLAIRR